MKKILYLGIDENTSSSLRKKLYNTNFLALAIGGFMCVPFMVLTFFMFKPVFFLPTICLTICSIVLFLNAYGFHKIGRTLLGISPFTLSLFFHAILLPAGSARIIELYSLTFCFILVPFLLFDLKEDRGLLTFCSVYSLVALVFFSDYLNETFEADINIDLIREGVLGSVIVALSVVMIFLIMITQLYQFLLAENESNALIERMNVQAQEMEKSQLQLQEKVKQVEQNQSEEAKRIWVTKGIGEVSTMLRSDEDSKRLFDQIVSYLSEYMGANQCGLFLTDRDGDDVVLRLQSAYAYSRKKFLEKEIEPGQGQIGQAYLEKEVIYLKKVPETYMNITSGLGQGTPKEVLIVPLIVNEEVEGVLEIASFHSFEQHQITFLEQLGETLAAYVNINRINERTKTLLEESQQQAEEMRAQEEEMRQNMEELAATQEEMSRKEQEYLNQIEGLKIELKQPS